MNQLLEKFRSYQSIVADLNKNASPGFKSDILATYHYYKHKVWDNEVVKPEAYFEILKQITGRDDLKSAGNLSQEGDKMSYTFINPDNDTFCVTIEPIFHSDNDTAFVATLFENKRR